MATISSKATGVGITSNQISDLSTTVAALIDPGTSTETVGRVLTRLDHGKTLLYTGTGTGNFTLPNDLVNGDDFSVEVSKQSTGNPAFVAPGGYTLHVATGKSAQVTNQYDRCAVQYKNGTLYEVI
jgi:hypothetical protein